MVDTILLLVQPLSLVVLFVSRFRERHPRDRVAGYVLLRFVADSSG